jgi:hypothetical protein
MRFESTDLSALGGSEGGDASVKGSANCYRRVARARLLRSRRVGRGERSTQLYVTFKPWYAFFRGCPVNRF